MLAGVSVVSEPSLIVAVVIALAICSNADAVGKRLGVMAVPDQQRKRHACPTPQVGGIAILLGFVVWLVSEFFFDKSADRSLLLAILLCAAGLGVVGFEDDQHDTSPISRILLLLVFTGVASAVEPEFIARTLNWGSFSLTHIPLWACLLVMSVAAVGFVNAVNMADGQNGVAGSMFVVWSGCLLFVTDGTSEAIAGVLFALSLVFLVFNLRGKLFLGDCGSYGVTFVFGLLVTLAHARGQVSLETVIVWLFIPVADCIRLLISRPLRGVSPFRGDRDHFHHRLEDKLGKSQGLATYAVAVGASSVIATLEPRFALVCLCALSAFYFSFAWLSDATAVSVSEPESETDEEAVTADNVVSLTGDGKSDRKRKGTL